MSDSLKFVAVLWVSLIMNACTVSSHTESAGQYIDSSTTTTRVKASLIDELGTSGLFVKVKTYKDDVQLSGFVDNQQVKNRAGMIAAGVEGVRKVRNDIIVKSR